ncbi:MAG TPA: alpha/beta hydrolase [Thermoflexia bacterium]|nr:alpha/beta hydrolase [Thermoflexia bacterium]
MKKHLFTLVIITLLISACSGSQIEDTPEPAPVSEATSTPEPMATSVPPTETPTSVPSPAPTEKPYEKVGDVPYADQDSRQKLDIYLPTSGEEPFPTLLAFHEGNFNGGSNNGSKSDLRGLARYFAERGYAVVTPNHRFTPQYVYPAQVQDAFCALAWIHANAGTYGFDTGRIVALGLVSGGNLAAMLGVVDDPTPYMEGCPHALPEENWVQGVATFTGLFDFANDVYGRYAEREHYVAYLGGELDQVPGVWYEASPINWVDGSEPPFLLIHGSGAQRIDSGESARMRNALVEVGIDVKLSIVDADHTAFRKSAASYGAVEALFTRISDQP